MFIDFYSHHLNRDIKIEVSGDWGFPILMFPTSQGSLTQNKDFGLIDSVSYFIETGKVKLYNVETLDSLTFYSDFPPEVIMHNYEQYLLFMVEELIPYIQRECNTHRIGVAGCSFGAYHAANIAFRYPDLISHLFSMSGVFSIRSFVPFVQDERIYFNCPEEYMSNEQAWRFSHMNIVLSTSDRDACKPKNQNMAAILSQRGINYWYDEKKWIDHDWPLWRMVFPEYLGAYFN